MKIYTFYRVGGVLLGLAALKQATDRNNNGKRALMLCPRHDMRLRGSQFSHLFHAATMESKLLMNAGDDHQCNSLVSLTRW